MWTVLQTVAPKKHFLFYAVLLRASHQLLDSSHSGVFALLNFECHQPAEWSTIAEWVCCDPDKVANSSVCPS